jgi:hypothetical protein
VKKLVISTALLLLTGCTHALHQYHVSDTVPVPDKSDYKRITSKAEQFTVLGFIYDTNYVDDAFRALKKQCSNGDITGIHTRYSTSHGFFSWTNKIKMTATCIK